MLPGVKFREIELKIWNYTRSLCSSAPVFNFPRIALGKIQLVDKIILKIKTINSPSVFLVQNKK